MDTTNQLPSLIDLGEDAISLLVQHITESKRPARTVLRTLSALSRTCKTVQVCLHARLGELRGLPVDVWAATSRSVPAQLTWEVENFRTLDRDRMYSPPFRHGPHTWRLLIFPSGDDIERHRPGAPPHLSAFVDVADAAMLPYGWVREAHFILSVSNKRRPSKTIVRYVRHDFEATARDWGFRELIPLRDLEDSSLGFVHNGTLTLQCKVWGVTDAMRLAERAEQQQQQSRQRTVGAGTSAVGASSATSTSLGSEDLALRRCVPPPPRARSIMCTVNHNLPTSHLPPPKRRPLHASMLSRGVCAAQAQRNLQSARRHRASDAWPLPHERTATRSAHPRGPLQRISWRRADSCARRRPAAASELTRRRRATSERRGLTARLSQHRHVDIGK